MKRFIISFSKESETNLKQQTLSSVATVDKSTQKRIMVLSKVVNELVATVDKSTQKRITVLSKVVNEFRLTAHFNPDAAMRGTGSPVT